MFKLLKLTQLTPTGNGVLDEVMTSLLHATEMFEEQRATEVQEEEAREAREAVKAEQDAAYMESLKADRAKVQLTHQGNLLLVL